MNGLLLIDKQPNMTSHDVVARARRILGTKSVGHAGTLDPMASGLLVLLIGEATKLSDYLLNRDKSYELKVQFGLTTDTWDKDGEILSERPVDLDPQLVAQEAHKLTGPVSLQVPSYSAIKVKGKKLYESARKGEDVAAPLRNMEFYDLEITDQSSSTLSAEISCLKGGYIRSWAHQLGENLATGACLIELRRLSSAPYSVDQSISLDELEKCESVEASEAFVPMSECLAEWPTYTVIGKGEKLLSNGQVPKDLERRLIHELKTATALQRTIGVRVVKGSNGQLLALLEAQPNKGLKIKRIFNL